MDVTPILVQGFTQGLYMDITPMLVQGFIQGLYMDITPMFVQGFIQGLYMDITPQIPAKQRRVHRSKTCQTLKHFDNVFATGENNIVEVFEFDNKFLNIGYTVV
jgi:hypothetical protein